MPRTLIPLAERLWRQVDVRGPDECWPWTGKARANFGYGMIGLGDRKRKIDRTHRVAFELTYGPIPKGLYVLHSCDNPPCCNPEHLSLGDHNDNFADVATRDRARRGEGHYHAKLTDFDIRYIRTMYAAGVATQAELASEHGITQGHACDIIKRRRWKHIAPIQGAS